MISENAIMKKYMDAQEEVNALMEEFNSEIQFFITGERACSHNCANCASKCSEK